MSELTSKLRKMLSQAQGFANDTPIEAVARAEAVVAEISRAIDTVRGAERDELSSLLELAKSRLEKYRARFEAWEAEIASRAAVYGTHERERLQQPIPTKLF